MSDLARDDAVAAEPADKGRSAVGADGRSDLTPTPPTDAGHAGPAAPERLRRGQTLSERRAQRRQALLDAALELFGTRGFSASSVEEICRTAYVSTRNFYEEFENREALLVALGDVMTQDAYIAMIEPVIPEGPDFSRREARVRIGAVVHALVDDPRVARVAFVESRGVSPLHEARRRDAHKLFARFVMGLDETDPTGSVWAGPTGETYALGMVGAINEVVGDWVLRETKPDLEELIDNLTEFFLLMRDALHR